MHTLSKAAERIHRMDRRNFLAASAATSLSSPVLAYQNQPVMGIGSQSHRIVKVILQGGPSQIDLWDLKPNTISEIRGCYRPISTNVAGIQISECLPRIATMMDQFTIVQSITGSLGSHNLSQTESDQVCKTGRPCSTAAATFSTAKTFPHAQNLLQAGHTDIVLRFGNWDHHKQLSQAIKPVAERLDQQLTQFIQTLASTGLLERTTVLVWGEFGRSPRMNQSGGRDHWPTVNSALIAGGPSSRGNIWGATSSDGSHIIDNPISMSELIQQCCHSTSACLA